MMPENSTKNKKLDQTSTRRRSSTRTRATISGVAEHCGLSKATVSRVLGDGVGHYSIKPSTAERVRKSAEALGYYPNRLARAISSNRTHLIGLALPSMRIQQFDGAASVGIITSTSHILISGILALPEFQKYNLVIYKYDQFASLDEIKAEINEDFLDGLIFIDPGARAQSILEGIAKKMPVVSLGTYDGRIRFRALDSDNRRLSIQASHHLIDRFGGNIAFVENQALSSLECMKIRRDGFREALSQSGKAVPATSFHEVSIENGKLSSLVLEQILKSSHARALMASSGDVALALLDAAKDLGVNVPEDLGLMTFGDALLSQYCQPSLSVVQLPFFDLARQAAREIISSLDHGVDYQNGTHFLAEGEIVERESTRVARSCVY